MLALHRPSEVGQGWRDSAPRGPPLSASVPSPTTLKCPYLSFQPFLSPLTDQWQQQRRQRLWFEGQVRPSGVQEAEEGCRG